MIRAPNKKLHHFNFKELERDTLEAYAYWVARPNMSNRTNLFLAIQDFAFGMATVENSNKKWGITPDILSYEYALYLFERIVIGSFKLEGYRGKFPLQAYVKLNIKSVITRMRRSDTTWLDLLSDTELFIERESKEEEENHDYLSENFDKKLYGRKLYKTLRIFYSDKDIRRLLPICVETVYDNMSCYEGVRKSPMEIRDFSVILISVTKRLSCEDNISHTFSMKSKDLREIMSASIRSTVFLSTVANTKVFSPELLLSLDLESLYRLSMVAGGMTIQVPSIEGLNSLLCAVVTVSNVILEGKDPEKEFSKVKKELDLNLSTNINLHQFISKAVDSYQVFKSDKMSSPIIQILMKSVSALDKFTEEIEKNISTSDIRTVVKNYQAVYDGFSNASKALLKITDTEN